MVLLFALSCCLSAVSAQWIEQSPAMRCPNPDPQPGVFLPATMLFPETADSIAYDDDTVASAWCRNDAGGGWGVKFISPAESVMLSGALINFYPNWPVPGDTLASLRVYAADGLNGAPGTQLFAVDSIGITRGAWNFIPVDVPVVAQNFYIFYKQVGANPNCPGLSVDRHIYTPSHRQWQMDNAGNLHEEFKWSDWMIRAVFDWTPQDTNAAVVRFARSITPDTMPGGDIAILATIKNMGSDTLPAGTPARLRITGPSGYVFNDSTATAAKLAHGEAGQIGFSPAWPMPERQGYYHIKVWSEAAGEKWPADDTIAWDLCIGRWVKYGAEVGVTDSLTRAGPERALKFHPADFGLTYPLGIACLRADFSSDSLQTWDDSSFTFKVYGGDGQVLLYESETLEATPGERGYADLDSMVVINTGDFYVAVVPVSSTGFPATAGDSAGGGHSYFGSPGAWILWPSTSREGEWLIAAAVQDRLGIEEAPSAEVRASSAGPTIMRGVLLLPSPVLFPHFSLLSADGREVMDLHSGANDVHSLAPGVYFVREVQAQAGAQAVRKVILTE